MSVNQVGLNGTNVYTYAQRRTTNPYGTNGGSLFDETKGKEKEENNHTGAKVFGAVALTALTAYLFRGKIKNTKVWQNTIKPFVDKVSTKAGDAWKNTLKPVVDKVSTKVADIWTNKILPAGKGVINTVKGWFSKGTPTP